MAFTGLLRPSDLDGTNGFRIFGAPAGALLGRSVAAAGDVNGDGIADLVIGASFADTANGAATGAAYVIFGRQGGFGAALDLAGLDGTDGFRIDGLATGEQTGLAVAGAGDVNGDGLADLVIGAPFAAPGGRTKAGSSFVVFGSAEGWPASISLADLDGTNGFRFDGGAAGDELGTSVGRAGDLDGDGLDDLVIGAVKAGPSGVFRAGESYVVHGSRDGFAARLGPDDLDGDIGFRLFGHAVRDESGFAVAGAGDVNGDGIEDLVVGALKAGPNGMVQAGAAYVVFGRAGGFPTGVALDALDGSDGFRLDGGGPGDLTGFSVAAAGDVNGDGVGDLVVGALRADPNGVVDAGVAYIVFGRTDGFAATLALDALDGSDGFRLEGEQRDDLAGTAVSGGGDLNGDGIDDLVVGARLGDPLTGKDAGIAYVVFGRADGFAPVVALGGLDARTGLRFEGGAAFDRAGTAVAIAGDLDGDGIADLAIGAPFADPGGAVNAGEVYIVFGTAEATDDDDPDDDDPDGDDPPATGPARDDAAVTTRGALVRIDAIANDGTDAVGIAAGPWLAAAPAVGMAMLLADGTIGYLASPWTAGVAVFHYAIEGTDGLFHTAAVGVETREPATVAAVGPGGGRLDGGGGVELLLGGDGNDVLFGYAGADVLVGGAGDDALRGGAGDDVLIAGAGRNDLNGGSGADLFVLTVADPGAIDVIGRLIPEEGDRLLIAIDGLLRADGGLDGARIQFVAAGGRRLIQADLDGSGSFATIAQINGGAGLDPGEFLLNAITVA